MSGANNRFGMLLGCVAGVCGAASGAANAQPATTAPTVVTGHISMDNHFKLFSGTNARAYIHHASGSGPDGYGTPVNFSTGYDFLYIAAWSDDIALQGFLADLTIDGERVTTSSQHWLVFATGSDRDAAADAPTLEDMNARIAIANVSGGDPATTSIGWQLPVVGGINDGTFPLPGFRWPVQVNIGTDARWIWWDEGGAPIGPHNYPPFTGWNHREYLIFRLPLSFGTKCAADQNGDGVVDGADLTLLLGAWGSCPTGGGPAPG